MNSLIFRIRGSRKTTRDGAHPDDQAYLQQLADTATEKLKDLGLDLLVEVELFDTLALRQLGRAHSTAKGEESTGDLSSSD